MTFIRNRWYVAAWDSEVDRTPVARTICGEPLMLYRRLDTSVVAMQDACPHRLLPLSMGIKEGDSIRCRYHGLLVGSDGRAEQMPLRNDPVNRSICVRTYPVAERHRLVWIWIGEAERADPALIPDFWPCSHPDWTFDGGYNRIECDYRLLVDNLMDLSHETYVHSGSIGQLEINETPIETETRGDEVIVQRWMPGIEPPPFWRDALRQDGLVDRWQICQFMLPSVVIIDVGVAVAGAGAPEGDRSQGVNGYVIDLMTPETETTHHYFWGMARNFEADNLGYTQRFKEQQGAVFLEDLAVLEAQQASIDKNPSLKLRAFSIDVGGVRARMLIDQAIRADTGDDQSELVEA